MTGFRHRLFFMQQQEKKFEEQSKNRIFTNE